MPKPVSSSFLKRKRRRTLSSKKVFNISSSFFKPILSNITSCMNDVVNSYKTPVQNSPIHSYYFHLCNKEQSLSPISPTFSQATFIQTEKDSLCFPSFETLQENELELLIVDKILTPTIINNASRIEKNEAEEEDDDDDTESDMYRFKPNTYYCDNELVQRGSILLNEMKTIAFKLKNNNISLGNLFRNSNQSYAIINHEMKNLLIELTSIYEISFLSQLFNISKKSIMRWKRNGTIRKKGAGRKICDPEMEAKVLEWYNANNSTVNITAKMIKEKAIEFSKVKTFQASKGWLEKYKKKYKITTYNQYKDDKK